MSTLNVTNLTGPSNTGTAATLSSINGGPISGARNRIINGDMRIDQRNAGATITGVTGVYSVDRWNSAFAPAASGKINYGRSTVAPAGFTNSLLHTIAAAHTSGTGDYMLIQHYIEGLNVADLNFGTASAASVTVSFWVRSSVTGTYSVAITNGSDNRAYVTTYAVNAANTWEYKSVTIPGDTTGAWATNNGKGISLKFDLGSGSNYVAASTNSWVATNTFKASGSVSLCATNGATFYLTGVQLEAGTVATPFERRSYGQELSLCQRYAVQYNSSGGLFTHFCNGYAAGAGTAYPIMQHPVPLRATPTLVTTGPFILVSSASAGVTAFAVNGTTGTGTALAVTASGLAPGYSYSLISNNSTACTMLFSAEL